MKKIIIPMVALLAWATWSTAQTTREQADAIVRDHIQKSEVTQRCLLYANVDAPSDAGIAITTSKGEKVKAKYACWAYCLNENPGSNEPSQLRYFFVKEGNGSLLEVITSNDLAPGESSSWRAMDIPAGLTNEISSSFKFLYPNPAGDLLTLPCNGDRSHVEIYDLKGTLLFPGLLPEEDACQLNVSFLKAGVYMIRISGETYKMIKN